MYRIPLTNSPNQKFVCTLPVNGQNVKLKFKLWYNDEAKYWQFSAQNVQSGKILFSNLPILYTRGQYGNILYQLDYMKIGMTFCLPISGDISESPNDENIGKKYYLIWGDNNNV